MPQKIKNTVIEIPVHLPITNLSTKSTNLNFKYVVNYCSSPHSKMSDIDDFIKHVQKQNMPKNTKNIQQRI